MPEITMEDFVVTIEYKGEIHLLLTKAGAGYLAGLERALEALKGHAMAVDSCRHHDELQPDCNQFECLKYEGCHDFLDVGLVSSIADAALLHPFRGEEE